MVLQRVVVLVACAIVSVHSAGDHDDHGSGKWEWAGMFHMSAGYHQWTFARVGGSYADASMTMLVLAEEEGHHDRRLSGDGHNDQAIFEEKETAATGLWDNYTWIQATNGQELTVGKGYKLVFDQNSWVTRFPMNITANSDVVFFCQHFPIEFENGFHFLKKANGDDVEPAIVEPPPAPAPPAPEAEGSLGDTILGSFLTTTPTFLGVIFFLCVWKPGLTDTMNKFQPSLDSFASGVLFAAAVFLLLPEAVHMASSGKTEAEGAGGWGSFIMLGWLTCILINHACQALFGEGGESKGEDGKSMTGEGKGWMQLAGPVLFGDFFHNLTDGLVIGAAFKSCDSSFAWKLVAITVAHEAPQEIADFFILINDAKMKWWTATICNFLSSLSTVVGAAIAYDADIGSNEQGYILAYGAGVYLFVAMTELGKSVVNLKQSPEDQTPAVNAMLLRLIPFAIGATALGLILLDHEHCTPVGADPADPHAGHNH